jgi:uncharacterized membrane protein
MTLVEFLQGKWLGHPLHAALVHVPVGGWFVACVLDVSNAVGYGGEATGRLALWSVGVGLVGGALAIPAGVADWSLIKKDKPAWKLGFYHMLLNLGATLLWAVNFGLRFMRRDIAVAEITAPILLTSVAGTVLVVISAYIGSLMVFDHGIGVARTSKRKLRQVAVTAGARVPEEK